MIRLALPLALVLAFAAPARAGEGFVIGLEPATGNWNANPDEIQPATCHDGLCLSGDTIRAFTTPIHDTRRMGLNLHFGWNILGHAAVEAVLHGTAWDVLSGSRGGAGMAGLRATWYPAQIFLADQKRNWDAGIELGAGYSIAGGPSFGMDGSYLAGGVNAEWYPTSWFSLGLGFRYISNRWNDFILNFNSGNRVAVTDYAAGYTQFFLGLNIHTAPPKD